jgi:hypothetical protein
LTNLIELDGLPLTRSFFANKGDLVCEYSQAEIVAAIYNYAWFVRLDLWLGLTAWFFVPENTWCFKTLLFYVARWDCGWKVFSSALHLAVRWPMIEVSHLVWLVKYILFMVLLLSVEPTVPAKASPMDLTYLILQIVLTIVNELYLGFLVRYPFPIPGRLRRVWMTRDEVFESS